MISLVKQIALYFLLLTVFSYLYFLLQLLGILFSSNSLFLQRVLSLLPLIQWLDFLALELMPWTLV